MSLPDYGSQILDRLQLNHQEIATISVNGSDRTLSAYKTPPSNIVAFNILPCVYVTPSINVQTVNTSPGFIDFNMDFEVTVVVQSLGDSLENLNSSKEGLQALIDAEKAKWQFIAYYLEHPKFHLGTDRDTDLPFVANPVVPSLSRVVGLTPRYEKEQRIAGGYIGTQIILPITARYVVDTEIY